VVISHCAGARPWLTQSDPAANSAKALSARLRLLTKSIFWTRILSDIRYYHLSPECVPNRVYTRRTGEFPVRNTSSILDKLRTTGYNGDIKSGPCCDLVGFDHAGGQSWRLLLHSIHLATAQRQPIPRKPLNKRWRMLRPAFDVFEDITWVSVFCFQGILSRFSHITVIMEVSNCARSHL